MKILLAVDDSDFSLAAVEHAATLPWPKGSVVNIVSVAEVPVPTAPGAILIDGGSYKSWERILEDHCVENITRAISRFAEIAGAQTEVTSRTLKGDPKAAILDYAEHWGADLIIFGTHGYKALERLWLGSVSRALILHAKCSVDVVRRRKAKDTDSGAFKVLLAVDGSQFSDRAVDEIADRPWPRACDIHVISVVDLRPVASPEAWSLPESTYAWSEQSMREQAENAVSQAVSRIQKSNAKREVPLVLTSEVLAGRVEETIIDTARSRNTDLIVVGSQGYSGLTRFLLGSVSQAVAYHAPCSVHIVRTQ